MFIEKLAEFIYILIWFRIMGLPFYELNSNVIAMH
jgi:hypothetical protein